VSEVDTAVLWDRRFAQIARSGPGQGCMCWLEPHSHLVRALPAGPVLDLGCGLGRDAAFWVALGRRVLAADCSGQALAVVGSRAPNAQRIRVDIRQPLPFAHSTFAAVVASLSLHYFRWSRTCAILRELRRTMTRDSLLLARFNSTGDINHGAVGHPLIESRCYSVNGETKRFYTEGDLRRLFGDWEIICLRERSVHEFAHRKILWEIIARPGTLPQSRSRLSCGMPHGV